MADDAVSRAVEAGARALTAFDGEDWDPAIAEKLLPENTKAARKVLAAALRSLASEPTPQMVDAGMAEIKPDGLPADRSDAAAAWRAMALKAAEQVAHD